MAKLKSSLLNMFLSLTVICVVAGSVLAALNNATLEPIAASKKAKLENAIKEVVPEFDNSPSEEVYYGVAGSDSLKIYPAKKGDKLVGVAVESNSMKGFSGNISIIVGFDPDGKIINYAILNHAETPGLGSKMDVWFKTDKNKQSIIGKELSKGNLSVSKDGGEVDAITASTITSRAFLDAVNRAYAAYSGKTDANSGATDAASGATPSSSDTDANSGATTQH
jgi:electron transport complex protein RnfG